MSTIIGIIPARYASSRFPGKALAKLGGKSILQRVYEQANKSGLLDKICVATDHEAIFTHVNDFGGNVTMTSSDHLNGTDRCYEALCNQDKSYDYVMNIQGDEPFVDPEQIHQLAVCLDGKTEIATLAKTIEDSHTLWDASEAKITLNKNMEALYFSRQVIPFRMDGLPKEEWHKHYKYLKHIGIYAFRSDIMAAITRLKPTAMETNESLEQLRWLEHGFKIKVALTHIDTVGIDTPKDLEKAEEMIKK